MQTNEENRCIFLAALRSGAYAKGPIAIDNRGRPILDDIDTPGWCAVGLAYTLFADHHKREGSLVPVRKALGVPRQFMWYLQNHLNDSPLTFPDIADIIEKAQWKLPLYKRI